MFWNPTRFGPSPLEERENLVLNPEVHIATDLEQIAVELTHLIACQQATDHVYGLIPAGT